MKNHCGFCYNIVYNSAPLSLFDEREEWMRMHPRSIRVQFSTCLLYTSQPNTDTLKLLSQEFEVSVNTLLGSPRQLICQCCGMPLNEDAFISREKDGSYNEDYCKWCYAEGKFVYQSRESLLDYLVEHMPNPDNLGVDDRRAQFNIYLSQLKHWK